MISFLSLSNVSNMELACSGVKLNSVWSILIASSRFRRRTLFWMYRSKICCTSFLPQHKRLTTQCIQVEIILISFWEFVSGWAAPHPPPPTLSSDLCVRSLSSDLCLNCHPLNPISILILFTYLVVQAHIITTEMTQQCSDLRAQTMTSQIT